MQTKLKHYVETSPLSHFYEFGLTPKDIKELIIETFKPYFENLENLEKYAVSDLTTNWLAFVSIYKEFPDSLRFIDNLLEVFNGAKSQDLNKTIETYVQWLPEIKQSISRFWSLHNNQVNLNKLCIEDFLEESMRMIGQTIEGLSKTFLKLLLQLNRIRRNKSYTLSEIKMKDLGVVIDELLSTTDISELLIFQPHEIRLNQWRNIAYHHNNKIINNEIFCWFNKNGEYFEFKVSRVEIAEILKNILLTFKLIRISETIFSFDNLESIQSEMNKVGEDSKNIRQEAKLIDFYSLIESQGFKIVDLDISKELSVMKLQDLQSYGDFVKRSIHSSQFLYNLWLHSESDKMVVEYLLSNGKKFLTSEIESKDFKLLEKESNLSKLLKNVKFNPHVVDFQNVNPFEVDDLPNELKEKEIGYRSQIGEKISLNEFIKQFSLSVFCNFLVLRSERFEENDISINVGSDGSMIVGKNEKGQIVFHVPASIQNKTLQKHIISKIEATINLYNNYKLEYEIVEAAKENNKYYFKKSQVRQQLIVNEEESINPDI